VIELDSLTQIGSDQDSLFITGEGHLVQAADQQFYVAPLSVDQAIGRYDWSGRLTAVFGGRGEAPGKYLGVGGLFQSPDSLLLVLGFNQAVWYDLSSLVGELRTLPVMLNQPSAVAFSGHRFIATTTGGIGAALFYSEPQPSGTGIGVSASPTMTSLETEAALGMFRSVAAMSTTRYVAMGRYLAPILEVWTSDSGLVRRLAVPAPWFESYGTEAWGPITAGVPSGAVLTVTRSIWLDGEGRLWTITNLPDAGLPADYPTSAHREAARRVGVVTEGAGADVPRMPLREQADAIIAVYEVSDTAVKVIAKTRVDARLTRFLSDSIVAELEIPEPGVNRFILYRFRLAGVPLSGGVP
jgi:hypothetical protein